MGKQKTLELSEESELMAHLKEHCARFYGLVYSSHPTQKIGEEITEMSVEKINTETNSLIGLVGEILEIPEREPLEESEMLAIHSLLENNDNLELKDLQRVYCLNKAIAMQ